MTPGEERLDFDFRTVRILPENIALLMVVLEEKPQSISIRSWRCNAANAHRRV